MKIQKILKIKLVILLLVLAGCATVHFQPIPGNYQVENGWAVLSSDSLFIAIRPQQYRSPNGNYQGRHFGFYIRMQNIAKHNVALPAGSFQLLADGKQYAPFTPELIVSGFPLYYDLNWQDPFYQSPEALRARQNWEEDRYHLLAESFSPGDILAGGKKEGYLFYHESVARAQKLELEILGQRIVFGKTKK